MKKVFMTVFTTFLVLFALVGCKAKELTIWVGVESQQFYQEKMNEYVKDYKEKVGKDFPVKISVKAVDTGTAAGVFLNDVQVGGDIITVAHDNLGKLIEGSSAIAPIENEALIAQIEADNHDVYVDAIKGSVQGEEYYFGVPHIGQALVLYYNTEYITEAQVDSWEGILQAAKTANKQAFSITGTDGFNNSFLLLAVDEETKKSSLKIYEDGKLENSYGTGADVLSFIKYGQKVLFGSTNGGKRPTESGWEVELSEEISISVIGGAWHYKAAQAALGSKLGVSILPSFTLTEDTVYDVANNGELVGKKFRSGTFADVKIFVKKKNSEYSEYLDDILLFLSSKEIQEESFVAANNLPSYKNATTEFEAFDESKATTPEQKLALKLASSQIDMFAYGMPQPFGKHPNFNFYYYSKNGPERLMDILDNARGTGNFNTDAAILAEMKIIENIWKTGKSE